MEKWKRERGGIDVSIKCPLAPTPFGFPPLILAFKRGIAIKVEGIKIELTCKCKHNKFAKQTPSRVINYHQTT